VLSRRIVATLDGALVGKAAITLQVQFHPFTPAKSAYGSSISCQGASSLLYATPLGRTTTVVRYRRYVGD
jgi:hypothetical protein